MGRAEGVVRGVLFSCAVLLAAGAFGADAQVELRIPRRDVVDFETLEKLVSIDGVDREFIHVVTLESRLDLLRESGIGFEILAPEKTADLRMCPDGWEFQDPPGWDCYPSYSQYSAFMHRLAQDHPEMSRLERIGFSSNRVRPHEILALKITDLPEDEEAEPEVFLTSTMHGDELGGWILLMRLCWELLENPGASSQIDELTENVEIWINPLANPDGTYFGGDDEVASSVRFLTTSTGELSGIDPNRNFPDFEDGPFPDGQGWAQETRDMMAFASAHSFVLSANLHSGAEVINYPWDTTCDDHPDRDWFFSISRHWAQTARESGPPGVMDDCFQPLCHAGSCVPGVTDGADWYSISGGRQDYMTFFRHGRELTAEICHTKKLPVSRLEEVWITHHQALFDFIGTSLEGIHGEVVGPDGEALYATIEVIGHDQPLSTVFTDPDRGDFHRLLLPGRYDLRVSAGGMNDAFLESVEVPQAVPLLLVRLEKGITRKDCNPPEIR